jgi:hypothetical protein
MIIIIDILYQDLSIIALSSKRKIFIMYKELIVTSWATAALSYTSPELLGPDRLSRAVLRFIIIDLALFLIWRVLIYPFFFNPLRTLPGPTVSRFTSWFFHAH